MSEVDIKGKRIWMVGLDSAVAKSFQFNLDSFGPTVENFDSAGKAIAELGKNQRPDLIIVDWGYAKEPFPNAESMIQHLETLASHNIDIPLLVLTTGEQGAIQNISETLKNVRVANQQQAPDNLLDIIHDQLSQKRGRGSP